MSNIEVCFNKKILICRGNDGAIIILPIIKILNISNIYAICETISLQMI